MDGTGRRERESERAGEEQNRAHYQIQCTWVLLDRASGNALTSTNGGMNENYIFNQCLRGSASSVILIACISRL